MKEKIVESILILITSKDHLMNLEQFKFREISISMFNINQISESEMNSLANELNKISNLNHPCLLKFIGYSPIDFKKQRKHAIITEYFSNSSLSKRFWTRSNQSSYSTLEFNKEAGNSLWNCIMYVMPSFTRNRLQDTEA